ncbi:MAG TPA: hypothetical protein VGO55_03725 [Allosphingosinicella sp.]|jgi:hypothetical protein|nr:hypothetical protein [Allosphingosinicella sp.]
MELPASFNENETCYKRCIAQFGFDSLAFVNRLSAGGWDARQAEALAEALTANAFNEIVTRPDLEGLETRLKSEVQAVKTELKGEIKDLELRLTIRMGMMFGATIAILGAVTTLT